MAKRIILRTGEALVEGSADYLCAEPEIVLGDLDGPVGQAMAQLVGNEAIQLHGAIGMADELIIGHWYKRLLALKASLGDRNYHLDRLTAVRRNLPYLLLPCAPGIKIDPSSVMRPTRIPIVRRMGCHAHWFPSIRGDHPDVEVSFRIRVKGNSSGVGRPARGCNTMKRSQLDRIRTTAVACPDLSVSRAL